MGFTKGDKSSRNFSKLVNALLYSSKGAVVCFLELSSEVSQLSSFNFLFGLFSFPFELYSRVWDSTTMNKPLQKSATISMT